jgi:uncharacterized membrane protein YdbT with pleckstrin-like domain
LIAKTTTFTFDRGRLLIEVGILQIRQKNIELYRIEDVSLVQNFGNRLTGDGAIYLTVSSGHGATYQQCVQGLAKISELRTIFETLRNLVLLLRIEQWGKGVIY